MLNVTAYYLMNCPLAVYIRATLRGRIEKKSYVHFSDLRYVNRLVSILWSTLISVTLVNSQDSFYLFEGLQRPSTMFSSNLDSEGHPFNILQ